MKKNITYKDKKIALLSFLLASSMTIGGCGESYEEKRVKNIISTTFDSPAAKADIENKTNGFYNDNMSNYYIFYGKVGSIFSSVEECNAKTLICINEYDSILTLEPETEDYEDYKYLCNLRDYIIKNNIEPFEYICMENDGAYIDFNQEYKDSIINNYGIEVWEYLQQNGVVVPVFSYEEIKKDIYNNWDNIIKKTLEKDEETTDNEENDISQLTQDVPAEYKILEQEMENDFYEKDCIKVSIKIKDNYQDVYSNYFLYSCGDNLTISNQEDINIVKEDFRKNGMLEEVQLLGNLKDYIIENEIKSIGFRYIELSEEKGLDILNTYGEDTYNYYKEKGFPIICFDSETLHEAYKNSLKTDEVIMLHLSKIN